MTKENPLSIQFLQVTIRDRQGLIFGGEAESVSSVNDKGPFDVLPLHANFISLIKKEVVLHLRGSVDKPLAVEGGVIRVKDNLVEVYLGILH